MSAQHHYSPEEQAAQRRMLQEFLGNAKPRFPQGRINPDDQGEIAFAIGTDETRKVVVLRFTKSVDWLGLDRASALRMAELIKSHAEQIRE